jgi:hypothetical protein
MFYEDFTEHEQAMVFATRSQAFVPQLEQVLQEQRKYREKKEKHREVVEITRNLTMTLRRLTEYLKDNVVRGISWTQTDAPFFDMIIEASCLLRNFLPVYLEKTASLYVTHHEKKLFKGLQEITLEFVKASLEYDDAYQVERFQKGRGYTEVQAVLAKIARIGSEPKKAIKLVSLEQALGFN